MQRKKSLLPLRRVFLSLLNSLFLRPPPFSNEREMQHLVLDRDVRDWVLVPLTLCIALMMLMRQYATVSGSYLFDPIKIDGARFDRWHAIDVALCGPRFGSFDARFCCLPPIQGQLTDRL